MKGVTSYKSAQEDENSFSMCLYSDLKVVGLSYKFLFATETQNLSNLFSIEMQISRFLFFIHKNEYRERNL